MGTCEQGCADGERDVAPIFLNLPEVGQKSAMMQESWPRNFP